MTPFRFHRDPLFLAGCTAYAVNRFWLKPHLSSPFLQGHFNDLWLIPCALPLMLALHRWLGWRDDPPPTLAEVTSHLLLWSVLFEALGPQLMRHTTGDVRDIACYWLGGLVAWAWWNRAALIGGHGAKPRMDTDSNGSPTLSLSSGERVG